MAKKRAIPLLVDLNQFTRVKKDKKNIHQKTRCRFFGEIGFGRSRESWNLQSLV